MRVSTLRDRFLFDNFVIKIVLLMKFKVFVVITLFRCLRTENWNGGLKLI